ncbi:acetylornithine transaminase [Desulfothermobacter acidiphilus]|uniref:acetylornithine transaminase n=1 Tax=Desulfothermobacter acidiphilus TaxID=1938353 RepID=UPI003F8B2030
MSWIDLAEQKLMPTYARLPVLLVRGEGVRVWDEEGREYLDFLAGIAVNSLGHCHPRLVAAVTEQAQQLWHCSNLFYTIPQVELAQRLTRLTPYQRVFFCNSGAEAVEGALKLARKHARKQSGREDKYEVVAARNSFHGRTYGALTATGQPRYHQGFEPLLPGFHYIAYNDPGELERAVGEKTAAILLEPIQGEGGVIPATPEFLRAARELATRYGACLIFDEVQSGVGRTGRFLAQEHYGVEADVVCLAKGLGGGFPIGAVLAREEVALSFSPGDHASTFGGNPLAATAGLTVLRILEEENLLSRVQEQGEYLQECLRQLPGVKQVRGLGLLVGVVIDLPARLVAKVCLEKGLLLNAVKEQVLRLAPPLVVAREDIDQAVALLRQAMAQVREGGEE